MLSSMISLRDRSLDFGLITICLPDYTHSSRLSSHGLWGNVYKVHVDLTVTDELLTSHKKMCYYS